MRVLSFKKVVILITALLLLGSAVVAVNAYSSATVQSKAEIKIVSTDQALLALIPGENQAVDGLAIIDEAKGVLKLALTIDPEEDVDKVFVFNDVFRIKNNFSSEIELSLESDLDILTATPNDTTLPPGDFTSVDFTVTIAEGEVSYEGTLQVKANPVD